MSLYIHCIYRDILSKYISIHPDIYRQIYTDIYIALYTNKYMDIYIYICICTVFIEDVISICETDFPGVSEGKASCLQCGTPGFDPWVGKILWRRKWHPTPVLLPGKSHGQRSMVGYQLKSRICVCLVTQWVWLFVILWTVACQAPLSMGFSRQEYWSGLLFPCPGDVPNPWIKPGCPILQAGS